MEDEQITELFWQRSEQGIAELAEKYGRLFRKIAENILRNERDAEECVNDAYLGVWNSIPPKRPQALRSYVCRIVRNLAVRRYRDNTAAKRSTVYDLALCELEDCIPAERQELQDIAEARELTGYLEDFLDLLEKRDRIIFLKRYWFAYPVKEIAAGAGLTEHNITVKLGRLRKRLRKYLEKRGVEI